MTKSPKLAIVASKAYEVTHCFHGCPFFSLDGSIMYCDHPIFKKDPDSFAGYIIDWSDPIQTGFPKKCPL